MLAAQKLVKAYDAANTAYLGCLDTAATQLLGQYKGIASPSEIQAVGALDTKIHNAAVDRTRPWPTDLTGKSESTRAACKIRVKTCHSAVRGTQALELSTTRRRTRSELPS